MKPTEGQSLNRAGNGEMRRRQEAIVRSGALRKLGSEGRLMFGVMAVFADYRTCEVKQSIRWFAKAALVDHKTAIRGVRQLVSAGVLKRSKSVLNGRRKHMFVSPNPLAGGGDGSSPGAGTARPRGGDESSPARGSLVPSAGTTGPQGGDG
jgi:hypothetical protein